MPRIEVFNSVFSGLLSDLGGAILRMGAAGGGEGVHALQARYGLRRSKLSSNSFKLFPFIIKRVFNLATGLWSKITVAENIVLQPQIPNPTPSCELIIPTASDVPFQAPSSSSSLPLSFPLNIYIYKHEHANYICTHCESRRNCPARWTDSFCFGSTLYDDLHRPRRQFPTCAFQPFRSELGLRECLPRR